MHRIRRYLSFANIVSLIALFVALGGSSYAVYRIKGSQIADRSIGERKLKLNTLGRKSVAEYSLGKVRNAKRADMVGNLRASQLKVRCPRQAYELAGTCLELQRRPAVPFRVANLDCAREGKRLPTYGELASLLSGGEFGEPSGGELTADTFLDGSGALRAVTVTSSAGTAASVGNDFAGARPYRCVSYRAIDGRLAARHAVADQPVFYYDLGSPYAYLAAERIHHVLPVPAVWRPILLGGIWKATGGRSWAVTEERDPGMGEVERRAAEYGLQPLRWPPDWPSSTLKAMRAATFAQQTGRVVAFSLAAFRQAFAGGRDLADLDNVLIAAAACELHPRAVLAGIETQAVKQRLREATQEAIERGVVGVPTVAIGDELFHGDDQLERAAATLARR